MALSFRFSWSWFCIKVQDLWASINVFAALWPDPEAGHLDLAGASDGAAAVFCICYCQLIEIAKGNSSRIRIRVKKHYCFCTFTNLMDNDMNTGSLHAMAPETTLMIRGRGILINTKPDKDPRHRAEAVCDATSAFFTPEEWNPEKWSTLKPRYIPSGIKRETWMLETY